MKINIKTKSNLTEEQVNELLYYYEQGISVGKEETKLKIINNLISLDFEKSIISKIVNVDENKLEQLIN